MPISPPRTVSAPGLPAGRQAVSPIQFVRVSVRGKSDSTYGIRYSDGSLLAIDDRPEEGCFLFSKDEVRNRGFLFEVIPPKSGSGSPKVCAVTLECMGQCFPAIVFADRVSFVGPQGKRCLNICFALGEGCKISDRKLPGCAWG
jgi:hypothetical protein